MKNPLLALALLLFATTAFGLVATGSPGVEDNTCWTSNTTGDVSVDVTGTTMGNSEVTVTDGDGDTGSTDEGTPDPDGGCADSPSFDVGGRNFRVKDGDLQFQNDSGTYIDMSETECDKPERVEHAYGTNSIGSLP